MGRDEGSEHTLPGPGHGRRLWITTDPDRSQQRRQELHTYFEREVLTGAAFVCRHAEACRASAVRQAGVTFHEGQLSYVGSRYDTFVGQLPFRVLVVGMETGRTRSHVSMAERDREVLDRVPERFNQRNAHMKGTTTALRVLFGRDPGADRDGELLSTDDGQVHVLQAYAMANLLLCSAVDAGSTTGRSTPTMHANCLRHLVAAIGCLEPTVVVSQGRRATEPSLHHTLLRALRVEETRTDHVRLVECDGRRFVWVSLYHPTRHWEHLTKPYLWDVVVPSLQLARELALEVALDQGTATPGPDDAADGAGSDRRFRFLQSAAGTVHVAEEGSPCCSTGTTTGAAWRQEGTAAELLHVFPGAGCRTCKAFLEDALRPEPPPAAPKPPPRKPRRPRPPKPPLVEPWERPVQNYDDVF